MGVYKKKRVFTLYRASNFENFCPYIRMNTVFVVPSRRTLYKLLNDNEKSTDFRTAFALRATPRISFYHYR
jgi:hypothetical protein